MTVNTSRWGAKIGPRLAVLLSQGVIYAHHRLHAVKHKLAMAIFHSISDEISEEVDVTLGPIISRIHAAMDESHPQYPVINFLHTQHGQLKAIVGSGVQASGILGSIATILNNELAPIVYNILKSNPALLPDGEVIVNAYAQGQVSRDEAIGALAAQGIQHGWAEQMLAQAQAWPDLATSAELFRRSLISHDEFVTYLALNGVRQDIAVKMTALFEVPLSPPDAALAVLRGNMTQDAGERIAFASGVTSDTFATMVENTGEPPGLEQLLEGYRRGFIDGPTLRHGILQSRYRDEWIPLLEKLRYAPMPTADAVNAVVQNHLGMDQGAAVAEQNGLEPGAFQTLYETAGEPLSRTEMEQLYNRGLASEADVLQAMSESRLKNKYNKQAFALHTKLPPIMTIQRALRYGGISHADAVKAAMELGYDESSATMVVNTGSAERLQSYKDRVVSATQTLYEDNIIPPREAESIIEGMNYTQAEAQFVVQASEFHREARVISAVVSAIKNKYIQRHITANRARGLLDSAGIPAAQRDYLMNLWEIEYGAYTRILTEAQVVKAVKLELISADAGQARLVAMGYTADDAALLIGGA